MLKTRHLINFLLLVALLGLGSCSSSKVPPVNNAPHEKRAGEISQAQDEDVSLEWFTSSKLKDTDIVSVSDAKLLITNVYQILDGKIFDPAFKKGERNQHFKLLLAEVSAKPSWSRAELTERISSQLKKLSVSHLRLLDPTEGEKLFRLIEQNPASNAKPNPAVSAQIRGEVGILQVKSFLIPQVTKAALDRAKAQLSPAEVILIDLRGNGGGAGSSISYLIEDIIGPDKVLWRDRTRAGLRIKEPYVFRGYFDDAINAEAKAEIKLAREHPYVEWRTRSLAKKDPRPYYVLVDDRCGSSCDLFAASVQENRGAKLLGVRTMGALLAGEAFKLSWQGFALIVPTAQVISPNGNTIEGVGVQPDIQIPECKNSSKRCLEKAVEVVVRDTP
ncbi:hypothetical protein SD80_003680 [Scytonema tolypothrichoides VB-61278]|nr:hypothetical protein SD80_003680 [Scytonema tolypothrichoides VB-61278]